MVEFEVKIVVFVFTMTLVSVPPRIVDKDRVIHWATFMPDVTCVQTLKVITQVLLCI